MQIRLTRFRRTALFVALACAGPAAALAPLARAGAADSDGAPIFIPLRAAGQPHQKIVYVVALSNDAATNARLTLELAYRLREHRRITHAFVLPMPNWTLRDYVNQCRIAPDETDGAYIVMPPSIGSASQSKVIYTESWTRAIFSSVVAECANPNDVLPGAQTAADSTQAAQNAVHVAWVSNTYDGTATRYSATLGGLAVIAAIYSTLAPSHTNSTTTTYAYPQPSPLPAGGAISSVDRSSSTTTNNSGNNVSSALLGAYSVSSPVLGSPREVDEQAQWAISAAMETLSSDLTTVCEGAHAAAGASPTITNERVALKGVYGWSSAYARHLTESPPVVPGATFCNW